MAVGKASLERASKGLSERKVIDKGRTESSVSLIEVSALTVANKKADSGLIESVKKFGVIMPCIAVKKGDSIKVIDGAKRIDALKTLGIKSVPTVIFNADEECLKKELSKFKAVKQVAEKPVDIREEKFKIVGGNGIHTVLPVYLL